LILTDPFFYLVAIPAVLMMAFSKVSGVGLGVLCTPLLALAVPVPTAAAIFLPLLFFMDVVGLKLYIKQAQWGMLRFLLPAGLLGTVAGLLMFRYVSVKMLSLILGIMIAFFLLQRLFFPPKADAVPPGHKLGLVAGFFSGLASFISHTGSPPLMPYLLPQKLPPQQFAATMVVFFFAINLSKWLPYAWLGLLDFRNLSASLILAPLVPFGLWAGARFAARADKTLFYKIVNVGLVLTAIKLLYDGLT
jgi:uncharacterized protein